MSDREKQIQLTKFLVASDYAVNKCIKDMANRLVKEAFPDYLKMPEHILWAATHLAESFLEDGEVILVATEDMHVRYLYPTDCDLEAGVVVWDTVRMFTRLQRKGVDVHPDTPDFVHLTEDSSPIRLICRLILDPDSRGNGQGYNPERLWDIEVPTEGQNEVTEQFVKQVKGHAGIREALPYMYPNNGYIAGYKSGTEDIDAIV